jgi:hypothetical protein
MKNKDINYERDGYIGGMREWGSGLAIRNLLWEGFSSGPPQTIYALEAIFLLPDLRLTSFRGARI